jgi:hypothetical protein
MEQSIGDTVNVEFGEPRLADNVIRGHIRFEQGLNSYGDHFCHPNHIPLLRWGQRIEPRSLSRQSRIRANHHTIDFLAIYSWKSSSNELGFPSANRRLDG